MKTARRILNYFLRRDEGVTTVEYAVMLAMILVAAIAAILNAGTMQKALWFDSADDMSAITPQSPML